MIKLPKPSPISAKGNVNDKCNYFFTYLKLLVSELERILSGININNSTEEKSTVSNLSFVNDGIYINYANGSVKKVASNTVLWSGTEKMGATNNVNDEIFLSEKISKQINGIVLVFSQFTNGGNQNDDANFKSFFLPKELVRLKESKGHSFALSNFNYSRVGGKYLYISDDKITGHADNTASSSGSGISYDNSKWALRYVIGV